MAGSRSAKRSHSPSSPSTERPSNRPSYDQDTIVAILVGPEEHRFAIHKDVICAKSGFFRAACSTRWLEGREKVVRLPEVKTKVSKYAATFSSENKPTCRGMVDLYLLGDVLDDVKLRNKAMQFLSAQVMHPRPETVGRLCENTPTTSILRKWTLDITVFNLDRQCFADNAEDYPADFVMKMATRLLEQTKTIGGKKTKERLASPEYLEPESDASVPEV